MKWQKPPNPNPPISYQPPAIKFAGAFGVQTTNNGAKQMTTDKKIDAKDVVKFLTWSNDDLIYLSREVKREHRTNQQIIAGFVFQLIKQWSNDFDNNNFDARNQATVTLSAEIVKALGDDFPPNRLPLI
jgi:hypothetical protein